MDKFLNIAARILMSQMFIIAGIGMIAGYAATQADMAKMGVPGALLPLVIVTDLGGGLALLFGFKTRWVALALAGFTVLAALIFHMDFNDQMQRNNFMKNLAIAGGLLMLVRYGAAEPSIDSRVRN